MEIVNSHTEVPGIVQDDKGQCKWQLRPSGQGLQSCSATTIRISSVCRPVEAAVKSVGCTIYTLPKVLGFFSTVPKRVEGDFVPNPAHDEEEFKALPKQEQTSMRKRTMKYLQGPDVLSLREEVVVNQLSEGHPLYFNRFRLLEPIRKLQSNTGMLTCPKLKHYYKLAFMAMFREHIPPGWTAGRAPARACFSYNLLAAVIADVMKAR